MLQRSKGKVKIEITKALQTVNTITSPTSQIRKELDNEYKQYNQDKGQRLLETIYDEEAGQQFIKTQFNKDSNSECYRSPYTNRFYPPREEAALIPPLLRNLEEKGNLLFMEYARMYYGEQGSISNFYVFESEEGLNFTFFVKKIYDDPCFKGVWSSSNVIEIRGDPIKTVTYKLQTSVVYELNIVDEKSGIETQVFGNLKKNKVDSKRLTNQDDIDEFHLTATGKMVEEMQTLLRQQIDSIFVNKTKEIVFKTRFINTVEEENALKVRGKEIVKMRAENPYVVE